MQFITDWRETMASTERLLSAPGPCFLGRVGGSDTDAVAALLGAREAGLPDLAPQVVAHLPIVQRYNGYYDRSGDPRNYIRYLEDLLGCYERSGHLFVCNAQLLSMYLRETLHPSFYREHIEGRRGFELLVDAIGRNGHGCLAYPYQFVEKMVSHPLTLFNMFRTVLAGKKVLVIGPFPDSIRANFRHRALFFKDYDYPEFELSVLETPITYSGLPSEYYPDGDWFETTSSLCQSISGQDFDIALMSCGSYALPIGEYISNELQKKAIYVGGVLQMYFGVMGRRYSENIFFEDQINKEFFIRPLEADRYLKHMAITPEMAREAFGAYF